MHLSPPRGGHSHASRTARGCNAQELKGTASKMRREMSNSPDQVRFFPFGSSQGSCTTAAELTCWSSPGTPCLWPRGARAHCARTDLFPGDTSHAWTDVCVPAGPRLTWEDCLGPGQGAFSLSRLSSGSDERKRCMF